MELLNQRICIGPECDRPGTRRSLCAAHYAQLRRGIGLTPVARKTRVLACAYPNCGLIVESGDLCKPHSLQMHRVGSVKPLRVNSVGSVSENCEVLAATGHAPEGLLCKCTECDREYRKRLHIKSRYGLSWDDYVDLLAFQGDACAVCRSSTPKGKGVWHVDHDHNCCPTSSESCGNCVRGILCSPCNSYGVAWYESLPSELQTFDVLNDYLRCPPLRKFKKQAAAAGATRVGLIQRHAESHAANP